MPGKRGRPPGSVMPERFVAGARRIIIRDGFEALTLQSLEQEVGASRSLINYHFGGRTGLLLAVVESLFEEMDSNRDVAVSLSLTERIPKLEFDEEFLSAYRERMILLVELLPHILRTEELRLGLRQMYHAERGARAVILGTLAEKYGEERAADISRLMGAVIDGLGLQLVIDREDGEQERYHRLWMEMLIAYLNRIDGQSRSSR